MKNFPVLLSSYLYFFPPQKFYWQVASNIFPKARIKSKTICKSLSSQHSHKNINRKSSNTKLKAESASETSSDDGTNRKGQDVITVWSDCMT